MHLRLRSIGLVAVGGAVGTAARAVTTRTGATLVGAPVVTLAINLVGSFALGVLLERLVRSGPDLGRRQTLRLLLGTGLLGGFTTYSSLAVDVAGYGRADRPSVAVVLAIGSVVGGLLTAGLGIVVAGRRRESP